MNVAIDIRNLLVPHLSGVGYYTCRLSEELVRDTSIQWYLYCNQGKIHALPEEIEVLQKLPNVHMVGTRYPNKLLNLALALRMVRLDRIIEKETGITLQWILFPNLGFAHVSRSVRTIQVVHDMSFERFPEYYSWKMRLWHRLLSPVRAIQRATYVVAPSESTARDIVSLGKIPRARIRVIPHGHRAKEDTDVVASLRFPMPEKFFVALSTIEPRKNFEGIVIAYKESGLYRQGIELVIAGGVGWKHKKIVKLFRSTPGVTYLGYVTDHEKRQLLSRALGLVYPSFYEGFGIPILEAFEVGTPVMTSDCSSLPEVAGGAAYLVRPHMISDIAHAMRDVALHEDVREWYRGLGKKRLEDFSWTKTKDSIRELLQETR